MKDTDPTSVVLFLLRTLDELAKKLNMPVANLKKAVEDYNGVVAGTVQGFRWALRRQQQG